MRKLKARWMKTLTAGVVSAAMLFSSAAVFAGVESGEKSADSIVRKRRLNRKPHLNRKR